MPLSVASRLERHPVQHVARERVNQHAPRLPVAEPARPQVEHRFVVDLAHRGAMRALDVVGEDLELRLGVDLRILGQQQRRVRLLRVGLLRVGPDDDLAVEDAACAIGEDALVHFAAAAVRPRVIDGRVVVDEPCRVGHIEAVERAFDASPSSTATTSLRTSAPPRLIECDA